MCPDIDKSSLAQELILKGSKKKSCSSIRNGDFFLQRDWFIEEKRKQLTLCNKISLSSRLL
ncbi:Hypothetical protein FKW44_004828, partial [Caligus rogercresseyi]